MLRCGPLLSNSLRLTDLPFEAYVLHVHTSRRPLVFLLTPALNGLRFTRGLAVHGGHVLETTTTTNGPSRRRDGEGAFSVVPATHESTSAKRRALVVLKC